MILCTDGMNMYSTRSVLGSMYDVKLHMTEITVSVVCMTNVTDPWESAAIHGFPNVVSRHVMTWLVMNDSHIYM